MPDRPVTRTHASRPDLLRNALVSRIGERKFGIWFQEGAHCKLAGDRLRVSTRNDFVRDWICRHYMQELAAAARDAAGAEVEVEVVANPGDFPSAALLLEPLHSTGQVTDGTLSSATTPAPTGIVGSPRPTTTPLRPARGQTAARLEDVVVDQANALAVHAARMVASNSANAAPMTLIVGRCGTGKSHLLLAIERERRRAGDGSRVRFMTAERFTNDFVAALRLGGIDAFRKEVRHLDLLLLDDLGFLANKTSTLAEFTHTLDALLHGGGRVVLTIDHHPASERRLPQPLVNRLLAGVVAELPAADLALRRRIAEREAARRHISLPGEVLDRVAEHCLGGAREVRGFILRLEALRQLDRAADLPAAALVALRSPSSLSPGRVNLESIIVEAAREFGVTGSDIRGNSRRREVVDARGMVAMLARELTRLSLPEIARGLGREAHSTVLQAAQRMRTCCEAGQELSCGAGKFDACMVRDRLRIAVARPDRPTPAA